MKRILIAVSAALLLAACNNKNSASTAGGTVTGADSSQSAVAAGGDIAYFNIDSLVSRYDMYIDLRAAYEQKAKKADTELTSKGRSLENDVRDYQDKIQKGLVTRSQAQSIEENLNKKQQSLMLNRIHYSITEYLKEFNSDYRYKMILSSSTTGPVLNADPSLDLTQIILEGLNKKYATEKPEETPKSVTGK